jgi:membrane protein YdbS with pleckstrin-like domain
VSEPESRKTGESTKYEVRHEFKPDRVAALWYPLLLIMIPVGLISASIAVILLLSGEVIGALISLGIGGGIVLLSWLDLAARLEKSAFYLYDDRFVAKTGGLFSDSTNELAVRNITYIAYELPFLERIFFKTGTVRIESAGSAACEIRMFHLKDPVEALEPVFETMRINNFRMKLGTPVQEHRVATAGKVIDLIQRIIGYIFIFIYIIASIESGGKIDFVAIAAIFCVGAVFVVGILVVRYLDLQSRRYRLYTDAVDFEEGFFTKRKVFIPAENISDTNVDIGLTGRIFGYCDVRISCQGAGKEIPFAYLSEGTRLMKGLDAAIEEMRYKAEKEQEARNNSPQSSGEKLSAKDSHNGFVDGGVLQSEGVLKPSGPPKAIQGEEAFSGDRAYCQQFTQNMARAVAPVVIVFAAAVIIALIVAVAIMILSPSDYMDAIYVSLGIGGCGLLISVLLLLSSVISAMYSKYDVKEDSVASAFQFIVTKNQEFSFDKVTSMVVYHNPIDWIFKTVSIKFTSIGSSTPLHIIYQKKDDIDEDKLLAKCGIKVTTSLHTLKPRWGISEYVTAPGSLLPLIVLLIVLLGAVPLFGFTLDLMTAGLASLGAIVFFLVIVVCSVLWSRISANVCSIDLSSHHVLGKCGVLFKSETSIPYRYVKGTQILHHLLSSPATLAIDIAGEILVGQGQNGQQIIVSNNFTIPFIANPHQFIACVNDIISTEPSKRNAKDSISRIMDMKASSDLHFRDKILTEVRPNLTQVMLLKTIALFLVGGFGAIMLFASELSEGIVLLLPVMGAFFVLFWYQAKALRYQICEKVTAIDWGVFYKSRKNVCYHQFDFLKHEQGIVNKLFGTGDLNIHTTGSSNVEISFYALQDHIAFEKELKERY